MDDGLATGATMSAAIEVLSRQDFAAIIAAVPVVAVMMPEPFHGVGLWCEDFEPITDAEVMTLLSAGRRGAHNACGDQALPTGRRRRRSSDPSSRAGAAASAAVAALHSRE